MTCGTFNFKWLKSTAAEDLNKKFGPGGDPPGPLTQSAVWDLAVRAHGNDGNRCRACTYEECSPLVTYEIFLELFFCGEWEEFGGGECLPPAFQCLRRRDSDMNVERIPQAQRFPGANGVGGREG